ncbi:MAG TPA: sorbosone dehydrogenase family protein [Anaerolineales bacterium]|nr:sorbosone dehydrogenase family protein [Anaerolineales bacterium]
MASKAMLVGRAWRRAFGPAKNWILIIGITLVLTACMERSKLPVEAGFGESPQLPSPRQTLIPTVNIAPAKGWPPDRKPLPVRGTTVNAFASGLDHPRLIYVLPNGDVLVAETNSPPKPEAYKGIKGWIMKLIMKKAGSGAPSANRITLLRDADGDGTAETRSIFLDKLNSPFGMALVGDDLYVANTDAVVRFPYTAGVTRIIQPGVKLIDLPAGPINHHWTKNIIAAQDGSRLYVSVGSNSNVAEKGMDKEVGRAAIWEVNLKDGSHRIYASGMRNPVGMGWEPRTGVLWTAVNERDELGSDLVPDYITSVPEGSVFGWPYSYFGGHVDERVKPQRPDMVAKARAPDYAVGTHTASLGLAFSDGSALSGLFGTGAFIGQHGSWNRRPHSGYKVIFVPFSDGKPSGKPIDVLTGFLSENGDAFGRPVGVAIDTHGALLVADDVGNIIWRTTAEKR